ncbi:MAG TPA: DUF6599 family protein [Candidatus Dormibacteraeota bacterium]|jgi:hypothetical protein|nr:DUF6599 family protein [Candidatus Dormibacteraeota bacterium]
MRKFSISLALLVFAAPVLPLNAQQLLPAQFGNWTKASCIDKPVAASLSHEAGSAEGAVSCQYTSEGGKIQVWVQKFHDPSAAYEIYTSGLHHGMMASLVGNNAAVEQNQLWMLTGNLVLRVDSQNLASEADLRALVKSLDGHADKTPLPPMRAFLPSDGLIQGTQRYSLGPKGYEAAVSSIELNRAVFASLAPELGFGSGAEVMLGAYRSLHQTSDVIQFDVLLLVEFPTPQLAEQQLHHIQPLLASKPEFARTTVERDASLLSLVLSPSSPEMAAKLRQSIKYDTAITWNEPSQTLTDPPWLLVLKTIFYAAGIFCGVAAIAGVLFGVFRLLMKRLFPGKVFDRSESVELLQLGLNSKEINPDDFY